MPPKLISEPERLTVHTSRVLNSSNARAEDLITMMKSPMTCKSDKSLEVPAVLQAAGGRTFMPVGAQTSGARQQQQEAAAAWFLPSPALVWLRAGEDFARAKLPGAVGPRGSTKSFFSQLPIQSNSNLKSSEHEAKLSLKNMHN